MTQPEDAARSTLREDLGTAADVIAIVTPVVGLAFWLTKSGRWETAALVTGTVGWLYLVAAIVLLGRPSWRATASSADIERAHVQSGVATVVLIGAVLVTAPLSAFLDTKVPVVVGGLLACGVALATAVRALVGRYGR